MKKLLYISFVVLFICCTKTKPYKDIKRFSLVTIEDYGCDARYTYYTEFKYCHDTFSIVYSDGRNLNYEELNSKIFYSFYDSLLTFEPLKLEVNYKNDGIRSTADGLGIMYIVLNDTILKTVIYTAMPLDDTSFGELYYWLFNKRKSLDTTLNLSSLFKTDFHNNKNISNWAVLNSIERNKSNFSVDDILTTIDTTTNQKLKEVMIGSLEYFKDERIIELLGPMLLSDLDKNKKPNWWSYTMLELTPIIAQDSSERKIEYLKYFLKSKNGIVRTESAKVLANYKIPEARKPLLDSLRLYLNGSKYAVMDEEFYAIIMVANDSVATELISFYDRLKVSKKGLRIKYLIATLNALLTDKNMSYKEFYRFIRNMNVEKEIQKLDKIINHNIES